MIYAFRNMNIRENGRVNAKLKVDFDEHRILMLSRRQDVAVTGDPMTSDYKRLFSGLFDLRILTFLGLYRTPIVHLLNAKHTAVRWH
jgi:hypothetical protein